MTGCWMMAGRSALSHPQAITSWTAEPTPNDPYSRPGPRSGDDGQDEMLFAEIGCECQSITLATNNP